MRAGLLLTDLYQLTMLQAYHREGLQGLAVFEFFVRSLPPGRSFLLCAGLEQVLDYLEDLELSKPELDWLRRDGRFEKDFVRSLETLRFRGRVDAMPEGTVFFPNEPILRVVAPLPQAQLVESRIINLLHYQTLVASKAARCVLAAPGRSLVDFGLRRSHGAEAGLFSARASYLAGFDGTATVEAGIRFGIPTFGTMAHSYVQAHESEEEAFAQFARANPQQAVLLLDTYDTERGARRAVQVARRLAAEGVHVRGVRLDSGDLGRQARLVRAILDEGGGRDIRILASGNLDEYALRGLMEEGAPIDGFGVGTRMNVSRDAPYLDCAYKLQEYDGVARRKRSEGKATWPGRKQVWRIHDEQGCMMRDHLTLEGEPGEGEALLQTVMDNGRRLHAGPSLEEMRRRAAAQLQSLPGALRSMEGGTEFPVEISGSVRRLAAEVDARGEDPARAGEAP